MRPSLLLFSFFLISLVSSCKEENRVDAIPETFSDHNLKEEPLGTDLENTQKVYVPIYSEIYQRSRDDKTLLTATLSIRNTSETDSLFIGRVDYYNTEGSLVRKYIDQAIYLKPLETIDYVINESDETGGTGANFIITYYKKPNLQPFFQAVMIGGLGNNSFSFTTTGINIE